MASSTTAAKFTLSKKQKIFLLKYCETRGNVSKATAAAGVARATYYLWKKDPGFSSALTDAWEETLDSYEGVVDTVAHGYTVPEVRPFMVPVTRSYMKGGKLVKETTHEVKLVQLKKHIGPDAKAAIKLLEAKGKHRGWGKQVEHKHSGGINFKAIVLKEVQPSIKPPTTPTPPTK